MTVRSIMRGAPSRGGARLRAAAGLPLLLAATACATGSTSPPGAGPAPGTPATEVAPATAATPIQEGVDFVVWRGDGSAASFDELMAEIGAAEAVLLGERHDDPVTHRVQYAVFTGAFLRWGAEGPMPHPARDGTGPPAGTGRRDVVLSLEMFERDVQYVVDEYLAELITEDHFLRSARPWGNYETDYRPLVEFAKAHEVPVIAANAPRRYVNRASRLGRNSLRALSDEAKEHLPPLPWPEASPAYRAEWDALMGAAAAHMQGDPLEGQTLWDAAMGHAIAAVLDADPDALVVHLAGGFHVENRTGTPEAVLHYRPGSRMVVVAIRPLDDPTVLPAELHGLGDFVVTTRAGG